MYTDIDLLKEAINIKGGKLEFDFGTGSTGEIKTSFGKGKNFKPYLQKDNDLKGTVVYSLYQAKTRLSTDILKALKGKTETKVNRKDYDEFIVRSSIFAAVLIRKLKITKILITQSTSPLVADLAREISKRLPIDVVQSGIEKISKAEFNKIKILDDDRVTSKIRDNLHTIISKAKKQGRFSIKDIPVPWRKFVSGYFVDKNQNIKRKVENHKILILDDVVSSGGSIVEHATILNGFNVKGVVGLTIFKSI